MLAIFDDNMTEVIAFHVVDYSAHTPILWVETSHNKGYYVAAHDKAILTNLWDYAKLNHGVIDFTRIHEDLYIASNPDVSDNPPFAAPRHKKYYKFNNGTMTENTAYRMVCNETLKDYYMEPIKEGEEDVSRDD